MINLVELGILGQNRLVKHKEYVKGVKLVMEELTKNKVYNGSKKSCMKYFTDKVNLATINMITYKDNKELIEIHIGMLALYNAIIAVLLESE